MVTSSLIESLPAHSQLLLSGYTYRPEEGPCWQVDAMATTPMSRHYIPVWDRKLSLQSLSARYCIGTYDLATQSYIPCPYKRQVKPPYQNCYTCFEAIAFNPAFYNVPLSQLSPRQQAHNRLPHCVYLAYFGPGIVKVGIAHHQRLPKRWLEQGARAATVLHKAPDAYAARALEEKIHKTFHIPERITVAQKKKLLHAPYTFEEAKQTLSQHCQAMEQVLENSTHVVQDLQAHYFPNAQPRHLLDADRAKVPVSGRVVGMVGDIVLYEQAGRHWMSSLKKHIGTAQVSAVTMPRVPTQGVLFG